MIIGKRLTGNSPKDTFWMDLDDPNFIALLYRGLKGAASARYIKYLLPVNFELKASFFDDRSYIDQQYYKLDFESEAMKSIQITDPKVFARYYEPGIIFVFVVVVFVCISSLCSFVVVFNLLRIFKTARSYMCFWWCFSFFSNNE